MQIHDFENYISTTIVSRGRKYFRDGHVYTLEQLSPTAWRAEVDGSDDYFVFVELVEKEIVQSVCTCPFDGPSCKHEVAVYLEIREALKKKRKFSLPAAIRTKTKEDILTLLEQMVNDFPALESYVTEKKLKAEAKIWTVQDAEKIIYKHVNRYTNYTGYIDEDAGELPFEGFYKVLEYAQTVIETNPVEAVTLALYCRDEATDLYEQCEEWLFDELLSQIDEASYAIIDSVDKEGAAMDVTLYLITELRRVTESGDDESVILNMLIELSPLAQSREMIEQMLETLSLTEDEKENYVFQLLVAAGTDEEVASYYTKEPLQASLRTQIIDAAVDRGHIEAALTLCANGIDASDVSVHHKKLWLRKAFYLNNQLGNVGAQRFIAFELAVKGDSEDFTRLKSLYTKDAELWADVLENYLQTLEEDRLPWHYISVLVEEKQWERLLRYCQLEPKNALSYAAELKPHYELEVMMLVAGYVLEKARRLNTRAQYRELAMELQRYAEKGYHEQAMELKGSLMTAYAKKRAFLEELAIVN